MDVMEDVVKKRLKSQSENNQNSTSAIATNGSQNLIASLLFSNSLCSFLESVKFERVACIRNQRRDFFPILSVFYNGTSAISFEAHN
jgi:hypothetical protein